MNVFQLTNVLSKVQWETPISGTNHQIYPLIDPNILIILLIVYILLILSIFLQAQHTGDGPPYPLPRSSSGRALLKGALARGHVKRTRCKGKNGKKGKGEVLDLIVTIDLVSNRNSNMVHKGRFALKLFNIFIILIFTPN